MPKYEKEEHLKTEKQVADMFSESMGFPRWKRNLLKKPTEYSDTYPIGLIFYDSDGNRIAFGEVLSRNVPFSKYSSVAIKEQKMKAAENYTTSLGLPVYIIEKWSCGTVAYFQFKEGMPTRGEDTFGSNSAREYSDNMVKVPRDYFIEIGNVNDRTE
jgi:hypothetical protein